MALVQDIHVLMKSTGLFFFAFNNTCEFHYFQMMYAENETFV